MYIESGKEVKTLLKAKKGLKYCVEWVAVESLLQQRFFALGIRKGASIILLKFSYLSHNVLIDVDGVIYAIKAGLANKILVKEA